MKKKSFKLRVSFEWNKRYLYPVLIMPAAGGSCSYPVIAAGVRDFEWNDR